MVLTNVLGAAYTVRAAIPALKETQGHVLLTGSVAGRRALPGCLYSATKWAVTAMGEAIRADLNGTGVRTTLIEPGGVDTPFFDNPGRGPPGARRHRPRGACTPSPSRRTSTSTRSWCARRRRRTEGPRRRRAAQSGVQVATRPQVLRRGPPVLGIAVCADARGARQHAVDAEHRAERREARADQERALEALGERPPAGAWPPTARVRCVAIVASSARPSEPPTWREVLTRPEASPASERADARDRGDRHRARTRSRGPRR